MKAQTGPAVRRTGAGGEGGGGVESQSDLFQPRVQSQHSTQPTALQAQTESESKRKWMEVESKWQNEHRWRKKFFSPPGQAKVSQELSLPSFWKPTCPLLFTQVDIINYL